MFNKIPLSELIIIVVALKIVLFGISLSDALGIGLLLVALNYKVFLPEKRNICEDEINKRLDAIERDTTVLKMRQLR